MLSAVKCRLSPSEAFPVAEQAAERLARDDQGTVFTLATAVRR
jgi:hypothetical protein